MSGELSLPVIGNLVDDPELRFTPGGKAVAKFRVASNPRYRDNQGQWKDGTSSFVPCVVWDKLAENIAESIRKGDRVVVFGQFAQRNYETREGEKRSTWELTVEDLGPSLRYGTTKFNKMARSSAGAAPVGGSDADPWATDGPGF